MAEQLLDQYRQLHGSRSFGTSGDEFRLHVQCLINELNAQTVLNYGCGQTRIHDQLDLAGGRVFRFDPAIPEVAVLPVTKADLVFNTDVLEHIPEAELDSFLAGIAAISEKVFFNIATRPAKAILPNGENAHCTIKSAAEWLAVLQRHFPQTQQIWALPGWSCMFVTWPSRSVEILAALERLSTLRRLRRKRAFRFFEKLVGARWRGWRQTFG